MYEYEGEKVHTLKKVLHIINVILLNFKRQADLLIDLSDYVTSYRKQRKSKD